MHLIWDLQVFYRGSDFRGDGHFLGLISIFSVKELFPIVLALKICPSYLRDMQLLVLCDNELVVYVINKMTSSEVGLMSLIRKLTVINAIEHSNSCKTCSRKLTHILQPPDIGIYRKMKSKNSTVMKCAKMMRGDYHLLTAWSRHIGNHANGRYPRASLDIGGSPFQHGDGEFVDQPGRCIGVARQRESGYQPASTRRPERRYQQRVQGPV